MRSIIFILFVSSVSISFAQNPVEEISGLSEKHYQKRKEHVLRKNGKIIGFKPYDESYVRPSLVKFLSKVKKVVKSKDHKGFKKLLSAKLRCRYVDPSASEEYRKSVNGLDYCYKYLKISTEHFLKEMEMLLSLGGCFSDSGGVQINHFYIPSLIPRLGCFMKESEHSDLKPYSRSNLFFSKPTKFYKGVYEEKPVGEIKAYTLLAKFSVNSHCKKYAASSEEIDWGTCSDVWGSFQTFDGKTRGFFKKNLKPHNLRHIMVKFINGRWEIARIGY